MANLTPPATTAHLKRLRWQNQCGYEVATDETCLYMRETMGSMIAGFIFGTVLCLGLGGSGVMMIMQPGGADGKAFGGFVLLLGLLFGFLVVSILRRGRWMITYDRSPDQGTMGQIRWGKKSLAADQIRCITTNSCGGNPPKRMVVAELQDGTYESLGPSGASTWPGYWAKQCADWMGLPYRESWS